MKKILFFAGVSGAIAVIFGAMGAHVLQNYLSSKQLHSFETGVKYQMYHTLVLIFIYLLEKKLPHTPLKQIAYLFLTGIILFSGSIYLLSVKDLLGVNLSFLGPITPLGGLFLIAGWIYLAITTLRIK